jgi:hypothetical protein
MGKTVEEAAVEYAAQKRTTRSEQVAFIEGARWAQRWIAVEEEMPKAKEKSYLVLTKNQDGFVSSFWMISKIFNGNIYVLNFFKKHNVKFWRPIDVE